MSSTAIFNPSPDGGMTFGLAAADVAGAITTAYVTSQNASAGTIAPASVPPGSSRAISTKLLMWGIFAFFAVFLTLEAIGDKKK